MPKGVFSPAVKLLVENTDSLWNKPAFPTWDNVKAPRAGDSAQREADQASPSSGQGNAPLSPTKIRATMLKDRRQKNVHLVVLTHGLHGNMGADLLYLKESIDVAARQATESRRGRHRALQKDSTPNISKPGDGASAPAQDQSLPEVLSNEVMDEEEEVIVRGFPGNAGRTEKGVQYLGKRVAKWVLAATYPDQGYLPQKKSMKKKLSRVLTGSQSGSTSGATSSHQHSSIVHPQSSAGPRAYKITSISFIAHSLGGLTQTYAIAYIHKHSPQFFDLIKPINFVAMASPFLGLSNENPLYVRFALDFGLVGRTGQDLGLSWRTPTAVRSGWEAMIGGIGADSQKSQKEPDPGSKPLLRILPTGHTHQVLQKFRNRTVYSNVVNDGIVPPRTSCLLFLDWSGLGRVEKARRENGLIGTTLGWGWAELTGANSSSRTHLRASRDSGITSQSDISDPGTASRPRTAAEVPQPSSDAVEDDNAEARKAIHRSRSVDSRPAAKSTSSDDIPQRRSSVQNQTASPISNLLSFLRPNSQKSKQSPKQTKMYQRSQTTRLDADGNISPASTTPNISRSASPNRPGIVRGESLLEEPEHMYAPPKTSIFESAGDLLKPPLPTREYIMDPENRPQTIFHDRVYHPDDIPAPRAKRPRRMSRSASSDSRMSPPSAMTGSSEEKTKTANTEIADMKVEEKIARAYHHGLSWRKVLVRLEPDAHNNIIVRRMFANAYGWPVVKHLVDTHFADTPEANTADQFESNEEKAEVRVDETTKETAEDLDHGTAPIQRTDSEMQEAFDDISDLKGHATQSKSSSYNSKITTLSRQDSARWDDTLFDVTDESEDEEAAPQHRRPLISLSTEPESPKGTSEAEIADFLTRSPLPADDLPSGSAKDAWREKAARAPSGQTAIAGSTRSVDEQMSVGSPSKAQNDLKIDD